METYRVASTKLLLCGDDGTASLSSVESTLAFYDCLLLSAAPAGLAANFRDGIPVIHRE